MLIFFFFFFCIFTGGSSWTTHLLTPTIHPALCQAALGQGVGAAAGGWGPWSSWAPSPERWAPGRGVTVEEAGRHLRWQQGLTAPRAHVWGTGSLCVLGVDRQWPRVPSNTMPWWRKALTCHPEPPLLMCLLCSLFPVPCHLPKGAPSPKPSSALWFWKILDWYTGIFFFLKFKQGQRCWLYLMDTR